MEPKDATNPTAQPANWMLPVFAMVCALLWGSAFPGIKYAYRFVDGTDFGMRVAFAGIRFTIAGSLLMLFFSKVSHWRAVPKGLLAGITLFQVVIQYILFYWTLSVISGVLAAIINATGSFWWVFLAPLAGQAPKPTLKQLSILLLGFGGVCLCVYKAGPGSINPELGVVLALIATLSASFAVLMVRPASRLVPVQFLAGGSLLLGGLAMMALSPGDVWYLVGHAPRPLILITLYLSVVSAAAFSLWYFLVNRFDVSRLSGYRFLIPVCGVWESVVWVPDEAFTTSIALGGTVVVTCVWLLERLRRGPRPLARVG